MAGTAILEKFQMDISATDRPIHFMFGYRVGFSGTADLMAVGAIFDSNKFKMAAAAMLDNFEWAYLRNGSVSRSAYIARIARSSLR